MSETEIELETDRERDRVIKRDRKRDRGQSNMFAAFFLQASAKAPKLFN